MTDAGRPIRADVVGAGATPVPLIMFGDPHGEWARLVDAVRSSGAEHAILLGDLGLDGPLSDRLAPVRQAGCQVWWIHGNHDADSDEAWEWLFADSPETNLGARVTTLRCREGTARVAGLGGHYKGKVWWPKDGDESPVVASRAGFLARHGRRDRFRGGLPRSQRQTIFPEDHDDLRLSGPADVLVCHESPLEVPGRGPIGFGGIDDLARDLGARLVVHGHHHVSYSGRTRDGIAVRGLGEAEPWLLSLDGKS